MIRLAAAMTSLAALVLASCGEGTAPGSEPIAEDAQITVDGGWVRIPPGGRDVTAGFVTVNANYNTRLVAVTTDEAERVELHTMAMDGDVMRMREVDGYDIRAGEPFRLASGGDHLMIFGLADGALDDGEMAVTLEFEDGATVEATLPASVTQPG
ncbi:MAG: copper chaperone PCu(A)C [Alphaproteobacteria bacterium]|nr:copper chaperone PCu(A)C [Alphaproteobacteria bacterium]